MSWPQEEAITQGVVGMLRVNMGLKPGEALLVVGDVPRPHEWQTETLAKLQAMCERTMLAWLVAEVARHQFPDCSVSFWPFPATGGHGAEPDEETAARMSKVDVVIALTTFSLSHTNARQGATKAGARLASMPEFEARMLEAGGPMAADYRQIASDCRTFAELLTVANQVHVRTAQGTDLRFSIAGRPGQMDAGLYTAAGQWGNLPAGETFAIPVEGTGEGELVAPAGWYPTLAEDMIFRFEKGVVVALEGGGAVGDKFRGLLKPGNDDPRYRARRNLAELGIGTNPNARKPDNVLEAEKIRGTLHVAVGDNIHMGGQVEADLHDDFVQPQPDLYLDGKPAILGGTWKI